MEENQNAEQKILEAARRVFILKGMEGARMQEIADEAGMNKALVHYYFRNKDTLFKAVFDGIFKNFFASAGAFLHADISLDEKLIRFIEAYSSMIAANPFVPLFIINAVNRDPNLMTDLMKNSGFNPQLLISLFGPSLEQGPLKGVDPRHLIISIMGMTIFPYAARPLMQQIYFGSSQQEYDSFLAQRKHTITLIVKQCLGL